MCVKERMHYFQDDITLRDKIQKFVITTKNLGGGVCSRNS